MLAHVRSFFLDRGVLEVDTPLLFPTPPIDPFIEIFSVEDAGFLHSSPEYGMKKLLAKGIGDIYQLSHVFRKGERSTRHKPEFSMIEWYRHTLTLHELIAETIELASIFLKEHPRIDITYEEAFGGPVTEERCKKMLTDAQIDLPESGFEDLAWALLIEPHFPQNTFVVIRDFPEHLSGLAQVRNGKAERFELFYNGNELANGYVELTTKEEYTKRISAHNRARKQPLPMPTDFLDALEGGIPPCVGVAMGFDRLMMLRHNASSITDILPN